MFPANTIFTWPGTVQPGQHRGHSEGGFQPGHPSESAGSFENTVAELLLPLMEPGLPDPRAARKSGQ